MNNSLKWLALLNIVTFAVSQEMNLLKCDGYRMHRCGDNSKCISENKLCDYEVDCDDFSDENFKMCKEGKNCDNYGQVSYSYDSCKSISEACHSKYPSSNLKLYCDEVKNGLKSMDGILALRKENVDLKAALKNATSTSKLEDLVIHLASSFNETQVLKNDFTGCPPLYINIHGKCVALFSVSQVTWFEAKQFCESIFGTLAMIRKLKDYEALLKQIKNQEMNTDFWIGGYVESTFDNSSTWRWMDEKKIELGGPYWSMRYSAECTKRGTSDVCYHYSLAPHETRDGLCLAMDYDDHYYFSDQSCHELKSPVCLLNDK